MFSFARRESSTSAWSKPTVIPPCRSRSRAEEACVWANRWLPRGAACSLHDGARQGFDGSAECLCKLQGRSSVRHEVPAYGQYEHNHSSQHSGTLSHSPPQSRPLSPFLNLTHAHAPPTPRTAPPRPPVPPPPFPGLNNPSLPGARTRSRFMSPSRAVPREQTSDMSPQT